MTSLVQPPSFDSIVDRVAKALRNRSHVRIPAAPGSGRTSVAEALQANLPNTTTLRPLDLNAVDGPAMLLLEAAHKNVDAVAALGQDAPLSVRATAVAEALAGERTLVVLIPSAWSRGPHDPRAQAEPWKQASAIIDTFHRHPKLKTVLVGAEADLAAFHADPKDLERPSLPRPLQSNLDALLDAVAWGTYADAARALRQRLHSKGANPYPWRVRLAVGALGLGAELDAVEWALDSTTDALARLLHEAVCAHPEQTALMASIQRFLALRRPTPSNAVSELTGAPKDHLPLLTACLGYGEPVRSFDTLHQKLCARFLSNHDLPENAHKELGDHYADLDGATAPGGLDQAALQAWGEKAHHWAHAGALRATEWGALELAAPELLWDRGRALSQARNYEEAAAVYGRCVERFPTDDYAQHYLGFNLERAGLDAAGAEVAYREAVRLNPGNPWWNSRLVSFLIHQARPSAARAAWREALTRVDPDESRVEDGPWLAEHFHFWIVRSWLQVGEPDDAAAVLKRVPDDIIGASPRLSTLAGELADAVEAAQLGHPLYPRSVPYGQRWHSPRIVPAEHEGHALRAWFPGRVVRVTGESVELVYADPEVTPPRLAQLTAIPAEDWRRWTDGAPTEVGAHVEVGEYDDGHYAARIHPPEPPTERPSRLELDAILGYLHRWKQQP